MGYFNKGHCDRLRRIAHLLERGFSVAATKETLDRWTEGHSLAHLLGVRRIAPRLRTQARASFARRVRPTLHRGGYHAG